jgi:hypothetical protein
MSKIEVNAVEPQSGTTLTLGASGDTVALAAGALQTGFGRTGTVDWSSTIRTSGFTAVNGVGYFCDTSSAAFTVTLPASPSVGDIVAIKDWSSTAATNNITIGRNGQKIEGNATDGKIDVHGDAQTLVFSGSSRGWMVVNSGLLEGIQGPAFVTATGGTVLTCGNYKVHVFTGPGTFEVTCGGNDLGSDSVEYLVVAGGGAGGTDIGGGGGAGGFRQNYPSPTSAGLPVTIATYPITVGAGGASFPCHARQVYSPGVNAMGNPGSNSVFSTITSAGGGGGGAYNGGAPLIPGAQSEATPGRNGGSGGGQGIDSYGSDVRTEPGTFGGVGNTPPVSPPQGNPGGIAWNSPWNSAGGGGAGAAGGSASSGLNTAGAGGVGSYWANPLFGPTAPSYGTAGPVPGVRYFAGGGGGVTYGAGAGAPLGGTVQVAGGAGGGGPGGRKEPITAGTPGTANTGGGGGGAGFSCSATPGVAASGAGGSGIVIIRYKYQ